MKYLDERIAEMTEMSTVESDIDLDIETIVTQLENNNFRMNQKELPVEVKVLFDDSLEVFIPEKYQLSTMKEKKIKYPSEQRPDIIYRNKRDTINLGFQVIKESVPDEHIKDMRDVMRDAYKQVNPVVTFLDQGDIVVSERPLSYYTFDSFALGGKMYNFVFITRLNEQLLIGVFNCAKKDRRMCENLFYGIVHTLKFQDEEVTS